MLILQKWNDNYGWYNVRQLSEQEAKDYHPGETERIKRF